MQIVSAGHLLWHKNGAILVIMDAFSKFVTTHMLRTKAAGVVAAALKQYFAWSER